MAHNLKNIATDKMKKAGVTYKFIPLPEDLPRDVPAHIQFHKITLKQAVPTMIFATEKGFIAAQRRADTKINFKKLKELAGVSQLALASEDELAGLGCEYGVVPLVGLPLLYFVDQAVLEQREIYGGSGEKLFALTLSANDLVKVNNASVGDFCDPDHEAGRKKRVFAGVRANARPHIGNYMGSIKGMVELQNKFDCIFGVMDLHTIIVPYDAISLQENIRDVVLDFLGAGLDPQKCHLIIQSQLAAEHVELAYYLGAKYPFSRIEDLPTYKDKKATYPNDVNVGLFYYPVLMAADILVYNAELVPVGVDQEPHLEVTREMARKMNTVFGTNFVEPKRFDTPGRSIPSLVGDGKMAKSKGGTIMLTDSLEQIKATLSKAVTDSGKGERFPEAGPAANLVTFVELFEGHDRAMQYRSMYKESGIRYGELKVELAEAIYKELKPIQERRSYFEEHLEEVDKILEDGKNYARKIAGETLSEVREKMGLG